MDAYHVALFVHLLALLAAIAAAAIVTLAAGRRARARSVRDTLEWHTIVSATSKVFPIALAVLALTGAYMVNATFHTYNLGFVIAGLTGVGALLASGIVLAVKGRAITARLQALVDARRGDEPPPSLDDAVADVLEHANIGIALGVVFDMTLKPGAAVCLAALVIGGALSYGASRLHRPEPAAEQATDLA